MFARGQSSQRNKVRASHNQLGGIHTGSNNFLWTDCKEMKPGLFTSPIVILAGETCKTPPLHFLLLSQILGAGKAKAWQAVATMALPTGNCRFFLVTRQRCGNHTPSANGADTCLPASAAGQCQILCQDQDYHRRVENNWRSRCYVSPAPFRP